MRTVEVYNLHAGYVPNLSLLFERTSLIPIILTYISIIPFKDIECATFSHEPTSKFGCRKKTMDRRSWSKILQYVNICLTIPNATQSKIEFHNHSKHLKNRRKRRRATKRPKVNPIRSHSWWQHSVVVRWQSAAVPCRRISCTCRMPRLRRARAARKKRRAAMRRVAKMEMAAPAFTLVWSTILIFNYNNPI